MVGLIIALLIVYLFIFPVVIFIAQSRVRKQINGLTLQVSELEQRLANLSDQPRREPDRGRSEEGSAEDSDAGEAVDPIQPIIAPVDEPTQSSPIDESAAPHEPSDAESATPKVPPLDDQVKPSRSLEERIASKWMIWLGGITVALSAVFLFRYAVDQGWITPIIRVAFGFFLGGMLLSAGEWIQRRSASKVTQLPGPNYIPPALTASGIFTIFVSLYAAHAMFGLLSAAIAFVALATTAFLAIALSLRQGWFVALVGILAGYLMPVLVESTTPNAPPLFLYLFILSAGALALIAIRRWPWFSFLAMTGALIWPLLWSIGVGVDADQLVLGLYLLGLAMLFAVFSTRLPLKEPAIPVWRWIASVAAETSGHGFALSGVVLIWIAIHVDFNAQAFAILGLYSAIAFGMGLWRKRLEGLVLISAILAVVTFLIWPPPFNLSLPTSELVVGARSIFNVLGPFVMPSEFVVFSRALWAFAALFGLGGYFALRWGRTMAVWAGISAAMPIMLFAIGYWRISEFEIDIAWAAIAMGLAVLMLLATVSLARQQESSRRDIALALYAASCTAAIALAFACMLREAWLTVALAFEILAISWIWSRFPVREILPIAGALLLVVLIRLVVNPHVLNYDDTVFGVFGWVVYGYGLPAAMIFAAARLFTTGKSNDLLVTLCEISALGLAFLMIALQLKLWTSGTIASPSWTFLDQAVQSIWWLVVAALLLHRNISASRPWLPAIGYCVLGAALILIFFGLTIVNNPLLQRTNVGNLPVVNLLGMAYLLPALLIGTVTTDGFDIPKTPRKWLRGAAGFLVFVYLTIETRRTFQGSEVLITGTTMPASGEIYAYSAVWLLFSIALLALAILRGSPALRYASLAVLIVTVVKVFLYDMSDLTGLLRVASFLGLGLTLIGIAAIYRHFVLDTRIVLADPDDSVRV